MLFLKKIERKFAVSFLPEGKKLINCCFVQEHRTEIDARAGTFQAFELFGHQLLQSGHFASAEVQEKLDAMNEARQDLERCAYDLIFILY